MEAREIERCIDEFGADVYRFCLKLCMNREDAEDLYQQTFLRALEREADLEWEKNPRAFSLPWHTASGRAIEEKQRGAEGSRSSQI